MLVHVDKNIKLPPFTDNLAAKICQISRSRSASEHQGREPALTRHQLWEQVCTYIDGVEEVFLYSVTLENGEHRLISSIGSLLNTANNTELNKLYAVIHNLVSALTRALRVPRDTERGAALAQIAPAHLTLAESFWNNVYPFLTGHVENAPLAPQDPARLAVLFTNLAADMVPATGTDNLVSVFKFMGSSDRVEARFCCQYLTSVLNDAKLFVLIEAAIPELQSLIVHSWIRCSITAGVSVDCLTNLTGIALKLSEVIEVMRLESRPPLPDDPQRAVVTFFKELGREHIRELSLLERCKQREKVLKYLGDVPGYVGPLMKDQSNGKQLRIVYRCIGSLVQSCSALLYKQGHQQSILAELVDSMVLPRSIYDPNKPLPQPLCAVLKDHLHLFICGLGNLYSQTDPYVNRKLREIIVNYFLRYPIKSGVGAQHPFITTLSDTFSRDVRTLASEFRHVFLSVLRDNFLRDTHNQQQHVPQLVNLLSAIMSRTKSQEENVKLINMFEISFIQLQLPTGGLLWNHVCQLVKLMVESVNGSLHALSSVEKFALLCNKYNVSFDQTDTT